MRGMSNSANNCFANSVMQALFSVPLFFNYMEQLNKRYEEVKEEKSFLKSMLKMYRELDKESGKS